MGRIELMYEVTHLVTSRRPHSRPFEVRAIYMLICAS